LPKAVLLSFLFCLICLLVVESWAAVVDQGFNPDANGKVRAIAVQGDGKIVIGGDFTSIGGVARNYLARLNSDGSLDTTFTLAPDHIVMAIAIQPNQQILIGGIFSSVGAPEVTRTFLARLNPDGSPDTDFNATLDAEVNAIVLQPDRKILIAGGFSKVEGATRHTVARLHPDGTLDTTFADPVPDGRLGMVQVHSLARQPDGKILVGGHLPMSNRNDIFRLHPDGSLDATFSQTTNQTVECVAVQPDGKILIGGWFNSVGGVARESIARLNSDGTLDSAFDAGSDPGVTDIALQSDGKILVGGEFYSIGGDDSRTYLARLNADGSLDTAAFAPSPYYYADRSVHALAVQPDGRILVGGDFNEMGGVTRNRVARFNPDASLETPFDGNATPGNAVIYAIAMQPDGKILVGGEFTGIGGETRSRMARLNPDGSADPGFNPSVNGSVLAIAVQADGNILIGGMFTTVNGMTRNRIARLKPDGTLDTGFNAIMPNNADEQVNAIAVQADDKILVGGSFTSIGGGARENLARVNPAGVLDDFFFPNPNGDVSAIALQADGRIVIGGGFTSIWLGGVSANHLARLDSVNGFPDAGFTAPSSDAGNSFVHAVAIQPDGKIVVGGNFTGLGGTRNRLARLNSNGSLDTAFNASATCGTFCSVSALALQADGKILAGGSFTSVQETTRYSIARITREGSLDTSFNPGANGWVHAIAIQQNGGIVVGGSFTALGGLERSRVGRLFDSGSVSLSVTPDGHEIRWHRLEAVTEVTRTTFQHSTNGTTWTSLGNGTRQGDGWVLTGQSFAFNQNFFIRARGYHSDSHSGSILESLQLFYLSKRPPVIRVHPVSRTVTEGNSVSFSSQAEGYPQPTVKWQVSTGSSWSDISGQTSSVYTHVATASENNYQYRALFTNSVASTASDPATLTVMRNQTLTVTQHAPGTAAYNSSFTVGATASSGLAVAITSFGACTGSGSGSATITMTSGIGTCTVGYSQPGNTNWNPAPPVTPDTTTATKASQTISFPLTDKVLGIPPFTVSATASSGLTVSYSQRTPTVCSVSGSTVTLLAAGTCTVRASQGGNPNYNPAQLDGSFTVGTIQLSVSPSNWLFGVEQLGNCASSQPVAFTVNNSGTFSCTLGTLAIGGPDAGQFSFGTNGCTGQTLTSGSSCTVQVKFCPTSVGSKGANLLIPSNDPQTPLTAFLYNHESRAEEARRRLPPVLYSLNVPEEMIEGQQYTLTWSLLGYDESYQSNIVFFNCTGMPAGTCGAAYGTHFHESGDLNPQDSEPGEWTYSGVRSTKFDFSYAFTPPAVTADTTIVIRFYSTDQADIEAGRASLSLLIPGRLSNTYYDSEGRRLVKIIKNQ